LGSVTLARIDLWEVGGQWFDVLEAESSEWASYYEAVQSAREAERFLVIVDRVTVVEWARGHGLGLHAVARALRTWADDSALVMLIAFPLGGEEGERGRRAGEALAGYWGRLGLDRVEGEWPPMMIGSTADAHLERAVIALCDWPAPAAN
jgi:hypothetical protein